MTTTKSRRVRGLLFIVVGAVLQAPRYLNSYLLLSKGVLTVLTVGSIVCYLVGIYYVLRYRG